jgi:hypothetical protein
MYFVLFEVPSRRELTSLKQDFGIGIDDQRTFNRMIRDSTTARNFFLLDTKGPDDLRYRKNFDQMWRLPKDDDDDHTPLLEPVNAEIKAKPKKK